MSSDATVDLEQARAEVRAWLAEHWDPNGDKRAFNELLADSGWAAPTWPVGRFGRGLPRAARRVVNEEFRAVGARGTGQDVTNLFAGVVLAHGTEEQQDLFLRKLVSGAWRGCLLYSEPGAGSDLAAVQTRAEPDGDGWLVNGQKVWTSGARESQVGLLLARTDWDVPKHKGVSFFLLPMDQDGVDVRPIPQVTGGAHFNEVFLTDARAGREHLLGELHGGWRVLQTALGLERQIMGSESSGGGGSRTPDPESPWTRVIGGVDYLELARQEPRDTEIRQRVAQMYTLEQVNRWNGLRARAERGHGAASPVASLGKLAMSRIVHTAVQLTATMLGPEVLLDGPEHPVASEVNRSAFAAFVTSIGGGTDQIQRNILGERVLGLPKEPEVDRDVPFREVRKAEATRRFS
ncbi:MAG: putative acyl-CoA dehydrogenase [Frankiales bacterium]|nr:putative acyl-CoA dehydrogenase [Frankiales bacterium]